jgi:hypothetical protein
MLTELSKEQEALIPVVRDEWINKFYENPDPTQLDENLATEFVNWVYSLSNYKAPKVIFADSPVHAQQIANDLAKEVEGKEYKKRYFEPSSAIGITNFSWVAFYDYFTRIGVINHDEFNKYKEYSNLNIYDSIMLQDVCIVTRLPISVKSTVFRGNRVPHCEDGSAIEFKDGFKMYFWNGMIVPEKWITAQDKLNKDDIIQEQNAEMRRVLMEILGAKRYYDILTDGNGLTLVDEDTDLQCNMMRLYETTQDDELVGKKVQFLEVVDPSTGRVYNIYPPQQNARNVWDAKAQTFSNEKLFVRHGDVGLTKIGYDEARPVIET